MCDEITEQENAALFAKRGITRRDFSKIGAGAAVAMMLPPVANAQSVVESDVMIETPDGMADAYFVHPAVGAHAAVIMWPDILSLRPAFRMMAKRLAESGYSVLVPNPFYRSAKAPVVSEGATFSDPDVRTHVRAMAGLLSPETCVSDGAAFAGWLDQQASVDTARMMGSAGYCMSGSYTFRLAEAMPERFGAGASFHGGGLAGDADNSPHRLVANMTAGMLVAIADNDDERDPEAKDKLRDAFANSNAYGEVEVYAGAQHGWCPPDSAVYDEVQAERAWARMLALFEWRLA